MRKLTYYISQSIDGFIAAPDGAFEHLMPFVDLHKWIVAEYPETLPTFAHEAMGVEGPPRVFDTVIMGRATYEPGVEAGHVSPYSHLRQYVVSSSLTESPSPDVTLVSGDPVEAVRALKAEDGDKGIWLCGGATLAGALYDEIDELVLKTYPVVSRSGIPLFYGDFEPRPVTPGETLRFPDGGSVTRYTRM
ncbi:dihydrofolate reductase family protein [Yinghuangia sp. YIM S09857]|uniref:dihydrofolate reductase family protein n=1 Tax=Yinghuangia sp. YIM S09857 TaxID=3436929 RepID=UPI003F5357D1